MWILPVNAQLVDRLQGRGGAGRAEGHDGVDGRVGLEGGHDLARGTGLVVQVDLDDGGLGTRAEAFGEAFAAGIEGGVADLLVDAEGVLDACGGHLLAGALAGRELVLADVGQDAQALVHVRAGVGGDDRDARIDGALDGGPERRGIRDRDHQALWGSCPRPR